MKRLMIKIQDVLAEAFEKAHCRKGRKDYQGRNEQGAYKIHCKYYDDGNYDCNYKIIDAGMSSYCGGKILVKGNCKNLVVKKNEGKNYAD